jgi:hypothetical protein
MKPGGLSKSKAPSILRFGWFIVGFLARYQI